MKTTCNGSIDGGRMGRLPCWRKAKRDGYCMIHHPEKERERRARIEATQRRASAAADAKYAYEAAVWNLAALALQNKSLTRAIARLKKAHAERERMRKERPHD